MQKPVFEIFRGTFDKDAVRVETVFGFSEARERMQEIAVAAPERYFVFGRVNQAVVARIDTRKNVVIQFVRKASA